jgi:multidrug efflux pump subunit AcrB
MNIISWFARNGVAANLLMVLILIGGLGGLRAIRKQVFNEPSMNTIQIAVEYRGASPEEVENAICSRIEERLRGLEDVKKIGSVASEGFAAITVELMPGSPMGRALDEIKARVDAIESFPDAAEQPLIQEASTRRKVLSIAISGDLDERGLRSLGERIRRQVLALPGITRAQLGAARPREISIEVSEHTLRHHDLTFSEVADSLRRSSLNLPVGTIRRREDEILLRVEGQADSARTFEDLTLITRPDGTRLRLGDIAAVTDGFAETASIVRFDGHSVIFVDVFRVGNQNVTKIVSQIKAYVELKRSQMPQGVELTIWQDDTRFLRSRLKTLANNGFSGLLLVFITLILFMKFRIACWVTIGIPITFLGTIWVLPTLGVTINMISLFSFLVVLGIVVDDAIVVSENIHRHLEAGKPGLRAAIDGAQEVAKPVIFSILTTLTIFTTLLIVSDDTLKIIPLVVIPTLLFSLAESLLILPAHLSHSSAGSASPGSSSISNLVSGLEGFRDRILSPIGDLSLKIYRTLLRKALDWHYATVAIAMISLLLTFGFVAGGGLKFSPAGVAETAEIAALLTMPQGTSPHETAHALRALEESYQEMKSQIEAEFEADDIFRHVKISVGDQPFRHRQGFSSNAPRTQSPHLAEICVELSPSAERDVTTKEIVNRWRDLTKPVPDALEVSFDSILFSFGKPIDIQLAADDLNVLRQAASDLKATLRQFDGVYGISDSLRVGKQEILLELTPEGESAGITLSHLSNQVRQAFYGEEVQRIQRGRDEIPVMLRYPQEERQSLSNLEKMHIKAGIPLSAVTRLRLRRGPASIEHSSGSRIVRVMADVDPARANSKEIIANLKASALPEIISKYQDLAYTIAGAPEAEDETFSQLQRAFLLAFLIIYMLLAISLNSYIQPMIVMAAIPFGMMGALWGHALLGYDMTITSIYGMIAVSGVVVNDSLILLDFINRSSQEGRTSLRKVIEKVCQERLRPLLLTSVTTFVGLTPLILEKSSQGRLMAPMAISIAFGVLSSTLIVLVLVPTGHAVLEGFRTPRAALTEP